jgi:hypothetical protein
LPPGVREDAFNPHPSPKPCKCAQSRHFLWGVVTLMVCLHERDFQCRMRQLHPTPHKR